MTKGWLSFSEYLLNPLTKEVSACEVSHVCLSLHWPVVAKILPNWFSENLPPSKFQSPLILIGFCILQRSTGDVRSPRPAVSKNPVASSYLSLEFFFFFGRYLPVSAKHRANLPRFLVSWKPPTLSFRWEKIYIQHSRLPIVRQTGTNCTPAILLLRNPLHFPKIFKVTVESRAMCCPHFF